MNAPHGRYRAPPHKMGINDCARPEERLPTQILCPLSEIERREDPGLVAVTVLVRMYRLTRRRYSIFDIGRRHRILARKNCQRRLQQTVFSFLHGLFRLTRMTLD